MSAPKFALPHSKGHLNLNVDMHDEQIVCVLMQKPPDETRKILTHWSRALIPEEQNYDNTWRVFGRNLGCYHISAIFGRAHVYRAYTPQHVRVDA